MIAGTLALSLMGTGCATKKYVAKTIAPVEQRVTGTENKNTEQDKQIGSQGTEIQELDRDLSRTKEKLTDTDNKATQAGLAARAADQKADGAHQAADGAQRSADGAQQAATGARSFAEQGLTRVDRTIEAMNKFQMIKSETVLFTINTDKLTKDAKEQLDEIGKQAGGLERYVIEVQGFTDKTGEAGYNDQLSERRAHAVARYLTNEHKVPLRSVNVLGAGYAQPVADDKTRDGRKQNRRVEVKLWVPENYSDKSVASAGSAQ
jgi:outer membrane protein OmpA-like peptidoglycan-associated protein